MNQSIRWSNNDFILKKIKESAGNGNIKSELIGEPVQRKENLPMTETKIGKIVYVIDENSVYVWNGSVWKGIAISDINITNEEIDKIFA